MTKPPQFVSTPPWPQQPTGIYHTPPYRCIARLHHDGHTSYVDNDGNPIDAKTAAEMVERDEVYYQFRRIP